MPLETARQKMQSAQDMVLPPPFTLVRLRELGDAFAHAVSIAAEHGAGTLVYVGRFDLAEFAVVLEPEEPLVRARRAFYAGMVALADALISSAQPETAITIAWPDAISVNAGLVGGGRLAWPPGTPEEAVPDWLVFGGMIRTVSMTGQEPGLNPLVTALEEEGFTDLMASQVVEGFARHLMAALDSWQDGGFDALAKVYFERLPSESGLRRGIDENGDLLISRMGKVDVERKKLVPLLASPSWYDPANKGPHT